MQLFSVFDTKAKFYDAPRLYRNIADASRAFESACRDANSSFAKFPADFHLYMIGEFDQITGRILPADDFVHVCSADQFSIPVVS